MDFAVVQIAIAFLPGMIWARIDQRYVGGSSRSQSDFLLNALVFGLASYAAVYAIYGIFGFPFSSEIAELDGTNVLPLSVFADEIAISVPVSLVLAVLWVYVANYKIFGRVIKALGASKRYGDEDVWNFTFNSTDAFNEYVHVRDIKYKVSVAGWISAFSDSQGLRELLIRDAITYDFDTGAEISSAPFLYIARDRADMFVESPFTKRE